MAQVCAQPWWRHLRARYARSGYGSSTRMGQHDDWGVLGEIRFPRAASGMLTWPQVNGMG